MNELACRKVFHVYHLELAVSVKNGTTERKEDCDEPSIQEGFSACNIVIVQQGYRIKTRDAQRWSYQDNPKVGQMIFNS